VARQKPTEQETALWRAAMQDVAPLRRRPAPAPQGKTQPVRPAPTATSRPVAAPPPAAKPPVLAARPPVELGHGRIVGLDRRSAERLSAGRLPIDGRLDLHGLTQAEAVERLATFIAGAHSAGKRCLLVITGKGQARNSAGILREQVPRWLNQAPNRAHVLAFDYARAQHGGTGALYVLLKRRREP
jgi:DNA-nicking Smr family endonuclease